MSTRTEKIDSIIETRKKSGRKIAAIQQWMWGARDALASFRDGLAKVVTAPAGTEAGDAAIALSDRAKAMEGDLGATAASLEKVRSHFDKNSLAVAVVGQAGMGKSTFLQSLTGLSDAQIPASGGYACTSTQSRIENLPIGPGYAEVFYYSRPEMLAILADCYELLKWPAPSFRSLDDFVRDFDSREKPSLTALDALWRLLRTYRDNAAALERDVFAPGIRSHRIELDNVASCVTYAEGQSRPENLGIARVEIHCAFPSDDVGKLSVVDTPGMNAASEERDKIILEKVLDETADFVLFIGIPTERGISQKEREMFDTCRRCARQASDIPLDRKAFYVANQAVVRDARTGEIRRNGADPEYNALWRKDFESGSIPANRLVAVDVKDPQAVRTQVLDPMIDFLVGNLPELDGAELSVAERSLQEFRSRLEALVRDARSAFALDKAIGQDDYRKLRELFDDFFPRFSGAFTRLVDRRQTERDGGADGEDPATNPFVRKIAEVFQSYRDEIGSTLSLETVQTEMDRLPGQGGAAFYNLLSYLRCRVRDCFSQVENACHDMVEEAKRDVSALFASPLPEGGGLGGVEALRSPDGATRAGSAFFQAIAGLCREATGATGCRVLAKQFSSFADFELKFSGFLEHKVSEALSPLRQGSCDGFLQGKVDFSSAESIRRALLSLGDEAVNRVACSLVEKSAAEPRQAIFAVIENFADRTLRTRGMEKEWIDFYEIVRAEVWPEVFDPNSTANRNAFLLRERVNALATIAAAQPANQ